MSLRRWRVSQQPRRSRTDMISTWHGPTWSRVTSSVQNWRGNLLYYFQFKIPHSPSSIMIWPPLKSLSPLTLWNPSALFTIWNPLHVKESVVARRLLSSSSSSSLWSSSARRSSSSSSSWSSSARRYVPHCIHLISLIL